MVNLTQQFLARRQTIIYGVKRGKIPLALRPTVPPQTKQAGNPTCLDEMSRLFNCWSASSFEDGKCGKEIANFLTCADKSLADYHKSGRGKKTEWNTEKLNELIRTHTVVKKRGPKEKQVFLNQIIK
ncbi:uncharacterized protein [Clytia hemisphaerica]|uniref:CHCH domain-containing protein n=1 Tax=Clytia hemisphaerica TaxID=252671 RepID=A0A7M5WQJ0_9CNID|eukprot:TCONS_00011182-protein